MSEGFLFVSNDKLKTLVRGRLPFRVIEWCDSFYHFRMEYETPGFVRYVDNKIIALPDLLNLIKSFEETETKFALFRLVKREGDYDLPKISLKFRLKDFMEKEFMEKEIELNTFYKLDTRKKHVFKCHDF